MNIREYLDKAIRGGEEVEIKYQKKDGTLSTRIISDIKYTDKFGNKEKDNYISAYCHTRQEERYFKISRIHEINGVKQYDSSNAKQGKNKKIYDPMHMKK